MPTAVTITYVVGVKRWTDYPRRVCDVRRAIVQVCDELLRGISREDLAECVCLLGLSLAHHRQKFGVVPFDVTAKQIKPWSPSGTVDTHFERTRREAEELVREALTHRAAGATAQTDTPPAAEKESRRHARINISAPIQVLRPDIPRRIDASLLNVSWGGAVFFVASVLNGLGDEMTLILPGRGGHSITLLARVLRMCERSNGTAVAVRFSSLTPEDEEEFRYVLQVLALGDRHGDYRRKHTRIGPHIDLQFSETEELKATLQDISAGGLSVSVPDPLELGQSVQASISSTDGRCAFALRARVANQQLVQAGGIEMYRIGLQFEHPTEHLRAWMGRTLSKLTAS